MKLVGIFSSPASYRNVYDAGGFIFLTSWELGVGAGSWQVGGAGGGRRGRWWGGWGGRGVSLLARSHTATGMLEFLRDGRLGWAPEFSVSVTHPTGNPSKVRCGHSVLHPPPPGLSANPSSTSGHSCNPVGRQQKYFASSHSKYSYEGMPFFASAQRQYSYEEIPFSASA